ncbi:MAG: M56 family metallopeptidase [Deferribacterota bacterium]|nr:M56 family metallopeptidase [Deferribacterota bacterium]
MDIYIFFINSYLFIFLNETIFYTLISLFIVERVISLWDINDPEKKQYFLYIPLILPPLSFFFYELFAPFRRYVSFREFIILDINSILFFKILNFYPFFYLFLLLIIISTLVFIIQEIIPLFYYKVNKIEDEHDLKTNSYKNNDIIENILKELNINNIEIEILEDSNIVIFSIAGDKDKIILSKAVISLLNSEELKAVIAHELAHIKRNKSYILILLYIFRALQFYNPISLILFRRIVNIEEMLCDKLALKKIDNPKVLAKALYKLFIKYGEFDDDFERKKILARIKFLRFNSWNKVRFFHVKIFFAIILILLINLFVI